MSENTNAIGFPEDYTGPTKSADFFKLEPGENEIRILANVVVGYEYWTAKNKPVRQKMKFESTPGIKKDSYPKEVWAMKIYDYKTKTVALWAIPQAGMKDDLWLIAQNAKYGGLGNVDLTVTKSGSGKETKYTIMPMKEEIKEEVLKASEKTEIDLEGYFDSPYEEETAEAPEGYEPPEAPFPENAFEK